MRYPLVQGQGNFGSIDGDAAAANRYTEARLDKLAVEMLRDIDKNTVDFMPNFDETLMEPRYCRAGSESPGQRLKRHSGWHGDKYSTA